MFAAGKRAALMMAAVAAFVALVLPVQATAHKKVWSTTTTTNRGTTEGTHVFSGTLSSPKPACIRARTLKVFENPWEPADEPNWRVWEGSPITSDDSGNWSFEVPHHNTWRYYVKGERKRLRRQGHRHFCGGFKSAEMEVFAPG